MAYQYDGVWPNPATSGGPGETRVVDPVSGGEKGSKKARFSLIPSDWLWALAEHYGVGATKYADRNWEKGYKWSLSLDAHSRHLSQWCQGENVDAETGSHHLIAAAWHLIALWWFQRHAKGSDDVRPQVPVYITYDPAQMIQNIPFQPGNLPYGGKAKNWF